MTRRNATLGVGAWALVTVVVQLLGLSNVGGILSLVLLGGLVGCPLAVHLAPRFRSVTVVVAVSVALSVSLSALTSQALIWFGFSGDVLVVVAASAYGIVIAALVAQTTEQPEAG